MFDPLQTSNAAHAIAERRRRSNIYPGRELGALGSREEHFQLLSALRIYCFRATNSVLAH